MLGNLIPLKAENPCLYVKGHEHVSRNLNLSKWQLLYL